MKIEEAIKKIENHFYRSEMKNTAVEKTFVYNYNSHAIKIFISETDVDKFIDMLDKAEYVIREGVVIGGDCKGH